MNVMILNIASSELSGILAALHRVLHAILTGRLILNIRKAAHDRKSDWRLDTFSIDWAKEGEALNNLRLMSTSKGHHNQPLVSCV